MKAIVMDTSNTYLVIALYENDKCIDKYQENGNKRQSEYALTYLNEMLTKNNIDMLGVEQMIITIGPGSYTGQRVALTIAKTLAAISKIKIKAVSSLHGYAGKNKAISVIDARSNKIFVGVYDNNHSIIEDQIMLIDDFETFKQQYSDYPVIGDNEIVGYDKIEIDLSENIYQAAKSVDFIIDVDSLVPHYLKDVEAKKLC
ncbi:tRNA (adenosine(37)-N6)-threonylcarbamoyltransferase complex dimerization subunit type 1 TsaB [Thomasclavelia cocleata]|uniref:tRNA (adenosine(37)-N6)-threonylcarbamoyltransferase complex dimerization subunit type 1 TsaB n=1 Tax=Thomasclavelia cocleata TaxID=69824 RepID=UPI00242AA519|nr:tRNA (adenosine(37)-N6)-threonylcarbamoyltransferase complex dimerization subunit type 1 TsaB [Thomasclavelia cocleata]MCI9130512.1 tRNA (adenosine(37)-N6)-threonylcarbamoyltransferase complex dimerization subunit type 1 TsaB [Thomasclavelia cocleata]